MGVDGRKELGRLGEASRDKHWEVTNTTLSYGPHRTKILEPTKGHLAGTSEAKTLGSDPPASLTSLPLKFRCSSPGQTRGNQRGGMR